ncbi:MAG: class E sortase [Rothia sp. (in: high G+C Gram-positive bacteria)]|nr:class E sortase [Rothia sp. (in: high G+C Gram-positive bacteria)]
MLFVAWQLWWTTIEANRTQQEAVHSLTQQFNTSADTGKHSASNYDSTNPPLTQTPAYGQAYGVVYIPRLGETYARPLAEGTGNDVLDTLGLGHYADSQPLGEFGNFALAGHRQTNGAVLDHIDKLQKGDNIYIQTNEGYYTYRVYESKIVLPQQVEVIAPDPGNPDAPAAAATRRLLTLTSCHPRYGDTERYIVHAEFMNWQPNEAGAPAEIAKAAS